ncbi:MAG TPA: thioredoxin-dependent thiol peroxidase [Anaerolineae bacterium]|nr:thioredoxin-dependent thiol peroxidase [Anaerolineae bacterium]
MTKLHVGDLAPDFEALTDEGKKVKLSDFRGKKVILYFYPKDNTSGCTKQAVGFRDHYDEIVANNAVVLGVSPDSVESHVKFKTKYDLPFHLLVDPDHAVAELYGVWGEKKMYGRTYYGIKRSHFVIDEEGRLIDVRYNVRPAKSVEYALKAIQEGS